MTYKMVALMPMRHNSERVPGKNYRPFGDGRPLFQHMLDVLVACKRIDKVVIDTDSPTVRDICAKDYPQVLVLERPEELRDGAIPMNRILLHDTEQVASEYYLQTHSTNPLMTLATVEAWRWSSRTPIAPIVSMQCDASSIRASRMRKVPGLP